MKIETGFMFKALGLGALLVLAACDPESSSRSDAPDSNSSLTDSDNDLTMDTPATEGAPATAEAGAQPSAAAGGPQAGSYHCTLFVNGVLQNMPGFTIGDGTYQHEQGGGGPISFDGQTVSFSGGPLDGQAGKVEPGIVRLYNAERSRTIIDCETKG